jgi:hypothetical protein
MKRLQYSRAVSIMLNYRKKAQFFLPYAGLLTRALLGGLISHQNREQNEASRAFRNQELTGYPNNHNYRVLNGEIVPSFNLYCRWRVLSALYPQELQSILDLGSCKGFFVMEAASRPSCRKAIGIDIHQPYILLANKVKALIRLDKADFRVCQLNNIIEDPNSFGTPFQTILIINTYHYMFWGSNINQHASYSHSKILSHLAQICSDRIIFSNPLEINDCPGLVQRTSEDHHSRIEYTRERFLAAASDLFTVEEKGWLGKRILYLLQKKAAIAWILYNILCELQNFSFDHPGCFSQ